MRRLGVLFVLLALAKAFGAAPACVKWRQTGDCDYNGRREPKLDQPCYALIYQHQSGYCECANGIKTALSPCSPNRQPFTCKHMCATEATAEPGPYGGADTSITLNTPGICTPTHIPVDLERRQHNSQATGAGEIRALKKRQETRHFS